MHNLSYGNEFDLQDNERGSKTHFLMKGCVQLYLVFETEEKANLEMVY